MENIASIILYKDHHYIVVNKPAGVPVQKDKTGDTSLHEMIMAYAKQELYLCNNKGLLRIILIFKNNLGQVLSKNTLL